MFKKVLAVFVSALFLGVTGAAAQAVITFKKSNHNFGTFKESEPQSVEFVFTNTGDKPLVIQQALASCGCTIPSFSQEPIAPGKSGKVKVVYNGKGKFPGQFKKSISVRSNASNELVRVFIEGNMVAETPQQKKSE
ncbi:DUF1573 domain-containing protein [Alloprevotella sp. OH1205_COT-284]|uniref:DUF1573 domain-containing protein n=1 Tax=Alloprevotella sp. OH1205_COT-284 TaxID=2491043 RepID=UPI000F5E6578|nr:DUF1573 domain-containing protein [Alloprevotella sp. OH1205_COT-284]RRD79514.1 DUF1573 domain-containing protein [Alloprevotella sp. OH1205_COT-284]